MSHLATFEAYIDMDKPEENFGNAVFADILVKRVVRRLQRNQERLRGLTERGPVKGTVWSTFPNKEEDTFGPLVLVLETPEENQDNVFVVEVSQNFTNPTENEIMLDRGRSGLHFSCVVRPVNIFFTTRGTLRSCAGKLRRHVTQSLMEVMGPRIRQCREDYRSSLSIVTHCVNKEFRERACRSGKSGKSPLSSKKGTGSNYQQVQCPCG